MNSRANEQEVEYVIAAESDQVSRKFLGWLNSNLVFPSGVRSLDFDYLDEDNPCMVLSPIQGAYKVETFINGNYIAQYMFSLIYRAQPLTNGDRLKMDETLNSMADMVSFLAIENPPNIGEGLKVTSITSDIRAGFVGRYENGDEDRQISMTMEYERKG